MPGGRPKGSTFTQEMGDKILAGIAEGNSLRTVLRAKHMPGMATVFSWLRTEASFRENYEVALATRADAFGEDILAIADNWRGLIIGRVSGDDLAGSLGKRTAGLR